MGREYSFIMVDFFRHYLPVARLVSRVEDTTTFPRVSIHWSIRGIRYESHWRRFASCNRHRNVVSHSFYVQILSVRHILCGHLQWLSAITFCRSLHFPTLGLWASSGRVLSGLVECSWALAWFEFCNVHMAQVSVIRGLEFDELIQELFAIARTFFW